MCGQGYSNNARVVLFLDYIQGVRLTDLMCSQSFSLQKGLKRTDPNKLPSTRSLVAATV